jgi:IS30 family transposase
LIVGKHSRSAIGTLVDRTSRAVRLIHLPCGHSAEAFTDAFADVLAVLPEAARRTLTWDQGSEMARHDLLAEHFEEGVFFADPGSPWQRGTNENTNGLLRQFFPKSKDLSVYTVEDLRRAEKLLNSRPRKILNWRTPDRVFTRGIG